MHINPRLLAGQEPSNGTPMASQSQMFLFRRVAFHEAGHAAALAFGMLGPDGIRLSATGGCTSIDLRIEGLQYLQRVRDRAAIAMAGLAADCILRSDFQSTHIDWHKLWVKSPELQHDIAKTIRLSWITVNHQMAWNRLIKPFLETHKHAEEGDVLQMIAEHMRRHSVLDWGCVSPYFRRAQGLVARCQCRRFIKHITEEFAEPAITFISAEGCRRAWDDSKPGFVLRWVECFCQYFPSCNQL